MTTLVALNNSDSLVMGCDSLATYLEHHIPLRGVIQCYFDQNMKLKLKRDGTPILDKNLLEELSYRIPISHITNEEKLFSLAPLKMGIMLTGITSIGDRTIKSLIGEFWGRMSKMDTKAFMLPPAQYCISGHRLPATDSPT